MARLKKCFLAMKITVAITVISIAALVIFMAVAASSDLKSADPTAFLTGIVVPASVALAGVLAAFTSLITAKITLNKLNKLDTREVKD